MSSEMFLRLWTRAPRIRIESSTYFDEARPELAVPGALGADPVDPTLIALGEELLRDVPEPGADIGLLLDELPEGMEEAW